MKVSSGHRHPQEGNVDWPNWFHSHGNKMDVIPGAKPGSGTLELGSHGAFLTIIRYPVAMVQPLCVDWEIKWSPSEYTKGRLLMSPEELRAAFGLSDLTGTHGDWLLKKYGGDSAEQGKYIRWKTHLNIPGPGTGNDYDANISIEVTDKIKEAIRKLLAPYNAVRI